MSSDSGFLLIPGAGLGTWIWDPVAPELGPPSLAVALPGRDLSGRELRRFTLAAAADEITEAAAPGPSRTGSWWWVIRWPGSWSPRWPAISPGVSPARLRRSARTTRGPASPRPDVRSGPVLRPPVRSAATTRRQAAGFGASQAALQRPRRGNDCGGGGAIRVCARSASSVPLTRDLGRRPRRAAPRRAASP